jgi:hypothetical protein
MRADGLARVAAVHAVQQDVNQWTKLTPNVGCALSLCLPLTKPACGFNETKEPPPSDRRNEENPCRALPESPATNGLTRHRICHLNYQFLLFAERLSDI